MARARPADSRGVTFETVHRRSDGTLFPVEVSSRGADVSGERLLLSLVRDITDRKRAEEALRESEERFRTLPPWRLSALKRALPQDGPSRGLHLTPGTFQPALRNSSREMI